MSMSTGSSSFPGKKLACPGGKGRAIIRFICSDSSMTGQRYVMGVVLLLEIITVYCLFVYTYMKNPPQVMRFQWKSHWYSPNQTSLKLIERTKQVSKLERVLMNAAMEDKTVIITVLNSAWTVPNSTFDLFLESFQTGIGTERLLKHVIAVCLDSKAYDRCVQVHIHCYLINTSDSEELSGINQFMSPSYLKLIWRRMDLLKEVLSLGYNFLFTDADILWFRDPFPRFLSNVDLQISCDGYNGKPSDKNNYVNAGFIYVKANNKTLNFYKYWCDSSKRFPKRHDQNVFNSIKNEPFVVELGITMRFLDTVYFGGFCQPSRDINLVNTMHANCCIGLENKVKNLRAALQDWKQYLSANTKVTEIKWSIPPRCGY
ncbi:uncharacterized protein At4g15970 [Capsella rubella]|uniref:uncharacterized protein At4g15970 n=1 Tax=Capsella rubella TaxID=81985 RepID=UPI000CD502C3|nr:uncharacterized protein At4g15970 [Capsella rubella]